MPGILTWLVILPLIALPAILVVKKEKIEWAKWITLGVCVAQFLLTVIIYFTFKSQPATGVNLENQLAFIEKVDWISFQLGEHGVFSSQYFLGLDGLNVLLIVLSGFILLIAFIASWNIKKKQKAYYSLYLILASSIYGCFASLDLLVFYIFFEFMLLPMYFLIGIWGGERREYAAIKFFLYTLVGSMFILAAILGLYSSVIDPLKTGELLALTGSPEEIISKVQILLMEGGIHDSSKLVHTFNMTYLMDKDNFIPGSIFHFDNAHQLLGLGMRTWGFLFLFIGFAIKLPLIPLHTWLPDAHVEAPTPMSIILAGIMLKIGGYGMLRLAFPIFPDGAKELAWYIGLISVITIVYSAYVALGQKQLKKLIAYSSVSHMGFVVLGLISFNSLGVTGAMYQMISHGLISGMLFLAAGVIKDRTHNLQIENYSGLASKMPYFTAFVTIAFFASLALPGFSGFIGEVFIFLGAFTSASSIEIIPVWMVLIALFGVVLTAAYYLWTLQRMFFGKYWLKDETQWDPLLTDLTSRELGLFIAMGVLVLLFGILPSTLTDLINPSIEHLLKLISE